jgi:hypothetical protein
MFRYMVRAAVAFLACVALAGVAQAQAEEKPAKTEKYIVDTGFLGVKLLDPHIRVLEEWGTPTRVEAVQMRQEAGGGAVGGANPFGAIAGPGTGVGGGPVAAGVAGGGGRLGRGGMAPMAAGVAGIAGPGAVAGGAIAGGGGGYEGEITTNYTRWVYERGDASYAFLIDENNKVIQIDALGIPGSSPFKTKGGIKLGSTFAEVMKAYRDPDTFQFKGETMQVRFLTHSHVVFQFKTLNNQQRVVYIVVAAGK